MTNDSNAYDDHLPGWLWIPVLLLVFLAVVLGTAGSSGELLYRRRISKLGSALDLVGNFPKLGRIKRPGRNKPEHYQPLIRPETTHPA